MIPLRLTVRNFLCYSEPQTVDFRGIHLACLAGDNGAGKTALLDAMTWALWGKCRAKMEDEVIHSGQTEAEVDFEFAAGDQVYRVIRKRRCTGNRTGTTVLELHAAGAGSFRSASESSVRATEKKIIDILRMDYETFINSAFLIQGRADLFTVKTPDERKKVLSDILGLDQFERLEARARELARQREREVKALEDELARIAAALTRRSDLEAERKRISAALETLEQEVGRLSTTLMSLREMKRLLDERRQELAYQEAQRERARQELAAAQQQVEEHSRAIARYEATLQEADRIREGYAALQRARAEEQDAADRFAELHNLTTRQNELQRVIAGVRAQLEATEAQLLEQSQRLDAFRSQIPHLQAQLTALEQHRAQIEALRLQLTQQRQQERDYNERLNRLTELNDRKNQLQRVIDGARAQIQAREVQLIDQIRRLEGIRDRAPQLQVELAALEQQQETLEEMRLQINQRREQEQTARARAEAAREAAARFREEAQQIGVKLAALRASEQAACPVCAQPLTPDDRLALIARFQEEQRAAAQQSHEQAESARSLLAIADQYKREAERLARNLTQQETQIHARLATLYHGLTQAAEADKELSRLRDELAALYRQLDEGTYAEGEQAELHRLTEAIEALAYDKAAHLALRAEIERLEQAVQEGERQITQITAVEVLLNQAFEAAAEWEKLQTQLAALRRQLEERAYAEAEQAELRRLAEAVRALGYDEAAHLALRAEIKRLEPFELRYQELLQAEQALQQERAALVRAQELCEVWVTQCAEAERKIADLRASLESAADVESELTATETDLRRLQAQQAEYRQVLGAVAQQLTDLETLARQHEQKQEQRKALAEEQSIYEELVQAFSRRGVQALIIDHVLPELMDETNHLLARMTGGRMHLTMTTQRLNQRGTLRETLDIRINDGFGTRNYELFSGGEAFRINFALRIALSKLLARRAGAPLRTLIIDEGFGTQDATGRERLIEAISTIQEDFDCVLVITHIDELRDVFPVRIMVEKRLDGSVVSVVT